MVEKAGIISSPLCSPFNHCLGLSPQQWGKMLQNGSLTKVAMGMDSNPILMCLRLFWETSVEKTWSKVNDYKFQVNTLWIGLHLSNVLKYYPHFSSLPARFCFDLLEIHRTRPERNITYTYLNQDERSKNLWERSNLNGGRNLWVFQVVWILWLSRVWGNAKSPPVSDWSNGLCQCLVAEISNRFTERQVNDKDKFKNPSVLQTHTRQNKTKLG